MSYDGYVNTVLAVFLCNFCQSTVDVLGSEWNIVYGFVNYIFVMNSEKLQRWWMAWGYVAHASNLKNNKIPTSDNTRSRVKETEIWTILKKKSNPCFTTKQNNSNDTYTLKINNTFEYNITKAEQGKCSSRRNSGVSAIIRGTSVNVMWTKNNSRTWILKANITNCRKCYLYVAALLTMRKRLILGFNT